MLNSDISLFKCGSGGANACGVVCVHHSGEQCAGGGPECVYGHAACVSRSLFRSSGASGVVFFAIATGACAGSAVCTMDGSVSADVVAATEEVVMAATEEVVVDPEPGGSKREQQPRSCVRRTMNNIQKTLHWEECDEKSAEFMAVEQQFHEEFTGEQLDSEEECQSVESDNASMSSEDDSEYESSFVTDDSGSEASEDRNWQPCKKKRCISANDESPRNEHSGLHTTEDAKGGVEDPGCGPDDPECMTHERLVLDVLAPVLLCSLYGSQNNTTESAGEDSADLSVP